MVTEATAKLIQAFHAVPEQTGLGADEDSDVYKSVMGYYTHEFKPRLQDAGQPWRGDRTYIPASAPARILQSMYISGNPNPVGEKLRLNRADTDCDYNTYHAIYHPRIRDFLESFGYYDIFLFDLEGNLVYSVFKETDYTTNFLTGPYKDTNFGDVYRKARDASAPGTVVIEDFKHYEPSYGAGASFTGAPVFRNGEKIGVVVLPMRCVSWRTARPRRPKRSACRSRRSRPRPTRRCRRCRPGPSRWKWASRRRPRRGRVWS